MLDVCGDVETCVLFLAKVLVESLTCSASCQVADILLNPIDRSILIIKGRSTLLTSLRCARVLRILQILARQTPIRDPCAVIPLTATGLGAVFLLAPDVLVQ